MKCHSIKKLHKDNSGMTIVEVLVGFVVLTVILASLAGIIAVSKNMYFQSVDTIKEEELIQTEIYKTDVLNKATVSEGTVTFVPAAGMPKTQNNAELQTDIKIYSIGAEELIGDNASELGMVNIYFLKKD